jgi:hypothetical protein
MPSLALLVSLVVTMPPPPPSSAGDQPRLTLEQAKRIVREQGARKAAETALDPYWGEVLAAIATADAGWLDLGADLRAHSDAEASETLDAAMGEALRRAPIRVLRRLDGHPFSVSGVCGNTFADSGMQGATDPAAALASQEAAVVGVQDVKLKARRDSCLTLIRKRKQP